MFTWISLIAGAPPLPAWAGTGCTDTHCQLSEHHVPLSDPSRPSTPPPLDRRRPVHTEVATFARG